MTAKKTETKEVTVTAPARKIGDPGVIAIGGVILDPVAQVDKINGKIVYNEILLTDYHFNFHGDKTGKLSIYAYSVKPDADMKKIDLFIVADELSSLDLEVPYYMAHQDTNFTVVTLVNSSSKNDYLRGGVILVNVDSDNNVFENSKIELGYGLYVRRGGYSIDNPPKRNKVENVYVIDTKFEGLGLPPGHYIRSEIIETTFVRNERDESKKVFISDSDLRWCNFREGEVEINRASLNHCGFHFTGDVRLHKVKLEQEYFRDQIPSIQLTSKFDLTQIDMAGRSPAKMIRVDADYVLITLPGPKEMFSDRGADVKLLKMSFRNPNSRRALRNKAAELLFGDTAPSEMEESVLDYFTDTVLSRCSMMNLMDTAQRLLSNNLMIAKDRPMKDVSPFSAGTRGTDIYDPGFSAAKEHDRTIYIDGNNFGNS